MAEMNIAITLDTSYMQHAAVMLRSLIVNNKNNNIRLFIICDDLLSDADWNKLAEVYKNTSLWVEKIRIDSSQFASFKLSAHATAANYYRIQMSELIPANIDKILYLDVDIVIESDLQELYNIDIENSYVAAIEDPLLPEKKNLGFTENDPYFNSGVMLMNLKEWRKVGLTKKLSGFVINNEDKITFWDQDAFNAVCKGHWKALSPQYNLQTVMLTFDKDAITYTQKELQEAIKKPLIIHYTGRSKPWHFMDKHPKKSEYYKYLRKTPWKSYKAPDDTFANMLRKHKLFPGFLDVMLHKQ